MPDGLRGFSLYEAIFGRRSLRRYRPDAVPDALIEDILHAATYAPSAHNRQPWRFAITRDEATKVGLARAMGERLHLSLIHI